jgi:group I intron endonuclease
MKDRGIIYSILNKVNGQRYIGQTQQDLSKRWRQHLQESKIHSDRPLYRAIKKYGVGMFAVRIIEEDIPINKLSERECYWIEQFDTYKNGYNATTEGEGGTLREDIREKISQTMQGVEKSEEHTKAIRSTLKKRNVSFTVRGDGKHLRCKVRATNVNTGEVLEFDAITDAGKKLNIPNGNITRAIQKGFTAGGYKWEKLENKTNNQPIYGKRILDGKIIHHFNSVREAGRVLGTGGDSGVRKALKNPSRYSWKGCRWYYEKT